MTHAGWHVIAIWAVMGLPLGIAVGLAIAWGDGPPKARGKDQ